MEFIAFNGDIFLAKEFLKLRDKYGIKTVIETGTYKGGTTRWLSDNFERVITVELNDTYFKEAQKNLHSRKNVIMLQGNTSEILPHLLGNRDVIIFLDAHWNAYNPLLDELDIIMSAKVKPKIVVVHDFKVPDHPEFGYDTYPNIIYEWDYIKDHIKEYDHYYNSKVTGAARGAIFLINNE